MRFDDRLATVRARRVDRPAARIARWRQLVDLAAQGRADPDDSVADYVALAVDVPVAIRCEVASALAGRRIAADVVRLFAVDVPPVAAAMLTRVRLSDADWLAMLATLGPVARGVLRHRRDMTPTVMRALDGFGAADLLLDGHVAEAGADPVIAPTGDMMLDAADRRPEEDAPPFDPEAGQGQIRSIISRIARFRGDVAAPAPEPTSAPTADRFAFETDADGIVRAVDAGVRGALIGETVARAGEGGRGVDAAAARAFVRRAPFRDARLTVAGDGAFAGEWRIAGVAHFGPRDGRFLGYRGIARRPAADEPLPVPAADPARGDTLRQVVHELRTPLNAIGGFAEMIRHQMRGPVATSYRDRADEIATQAGHLLAAIEDLDVAARLDGRRIDLARRPVPLGSLVRAVAHGSGIVPAVPDDLPDALGDEGAIRRIVERVAGVAAAASDDPVAIVGEAVPGEAVPGAVVLRIARPPALAAIADARLFDPLDPAGEAVAGGAPLGLAFTLRLARRLARAGGGELGLEPDWFVLRLPDALASAVSETG